MCGIVGAVAQRNVEAILLEGLKRMEYRGYDSAGMVVLDAQGGLQRKRTLGKVEVLAAALEKTALVGTTGIAHTRWATHGKPSYNNAHPHICRDTVAIVHNGIIENYQTLRQAQTKKGHQFTSETDTEVVVHELYDQLQAGQDLLDAVRKTVAILEGAYALGVIHKDQTNRLVAARKGSPLVVGIGIGEHFIASDIFAMLPVTQRFIFLEEGDIVDLRPDRIIIYNQKGQKVERPIRKSEVSGAAVEKGHYRHYMLKEIFEQPKAVADTLEGRISGSQVLDQSFGPDAVAIFDRVCRVQIVACGTSYHAGMVARYWLEALAGIPCAVDVASEFRYRKPIVSPNTLFVTLSQSGETADTLAALQLAKKLGYSHTLAICNMPESALVRDSEIVLMTRAGPEVGVASTKAFSTQLVAMLLLVIVLGRRHALSKKQESLLVSQLQLLPAQIKQVLKRSELVKHMAEAFADKQHALFLGRGVQYPIAMEGALKLKEISYIHAEAYPAGELKHGPLALIDSQMPVVAVAANDALLEKLKSNLQEVKARGGQLFVFADDHAAMDCGPEVALIRVAPTENITAPIIHTIPLQLLAYYVAILKGTDIDHPRNLAKSVTVE